MHQAVSLRALYRNLALVAFNAFVLFALVNVAADLYLRTPQSDAASHFFTTAEKRAADPELFARLYPGRSAEDISQLSTPPPFASHPTLEVIGRPTRSGYYRSGTENLRGSSALPATTSTAALHGAVWVFGGSTVFGAGVTGDETIPAYLDGLDPTARYVNFGTTGYNQNNELAKLILLLKKGLTPRRVIFVDGLNDAIAMLGTPFLPEETPAIRTSPYAMAFNVGSLEERRHRVLFEALPIVGAWRRWSTPATAITSDVYDPNDPYVLNPLAHYLGLGSRFEGRAQHSDRYEKKLLRFYASNLSQLSHLARGYDFEAFVFFQPNGLLDAHGRFVKDPERYEQSELYFLTHKLHDATRVAVQNGQLQGLIDLSETGANLDLAYLDAVHYTPAMNRAIAERIFQHTGPAPPPTR